VLPVAIARAHGISIASEPTLADSQLYLVRRKPLGTSAVEALIPAIRARAKAVLDRS
jgi:hypothetical protein